MTTKTIDELPAATSVAGGDYVLLRQGGVSKKAAASLLTGSGGVTSVNGRTGAVTLTGADVGLSGHAGSGGSAHANVVAAGAAGFMTGADKTKLDGIATGATANLGTVTGVTGTAPVVSSGGTTPAISMAAANTSTNGYLTSTDWNTFNGKQPAGTYATGGGTATGTNTGDQTNISGNAATASMLQGSSVIAYGASGTQWLSQIGVGGAGTNGVAPPNPSNDWYHHLICNHPNSAGYYVDFALCFHSDDFAIRRVSNGVDHGWRTLRHTGNFVAGNDYLTPTGSAAGLTSFPTLNQNTTGAAGKVTVSDTRGVTTTPETLPAMGVVFDFKRNSSESLSDGGYYFGEMTFRQYGETTDWSGGNSHQLGFTDNGNVWQRSGRSTSWGAWKTLRDTVNFVAGTDYIAPTGSIAGATGLTSAQVTTALGYTPGSAGGLSSSVISTNTTATASGVYVMTASLTLTLPASPSAGNYVRFSNMSSTTTCVIGRNGQNIMGVAEDLTVDQLYAGAELMYADATRGWVFV